MLAFEQVRDYLYKSISKLDERPQISSDGNQMNAITWTASKAELIELAYALQSSHAFNYGRTDVKQVVTVLEDSFNIKLGNFYRVFQEQRIRKKSRTIFLDALKENLTKRMDDSDLNPRGN